MLPGALIGCLFLYYFGYRYWRSMAFLSLRVRNAERRLANAVMRYGKTTSMQNIPSCDSEPQEMRQISAGLYENLFVWKLPQAHVLVCVKTESDVGIVHVVISRPDRCIWRQHQKMPDRVTRSAQEDYLAELVSTRKLVHGK